VSFCPHCRSGNDPVLKDTTWSCGVRFNDSAWRTKECYRRNLEAANERIKRLEKAGDELASWSPSITHSSNWRKAKEAKL
jgi:hypothetical protein